MSGPWNGKVWARHYQDAWQEKVGNATLPLWLRITAVAYGGHKRNGHAPLGPGELCLALSVVDTGTGEFHSPSPQQVSNAIKTAIRYSFLSSASCARCLVVPAHAVEGGLGRVDDRCLWHDRHGTSLSG